MLIGFSAVGLLCTVVALFAKKPLIKLGDWEASWGEYGRVRGSQAAGFFAFTALFVILAVLFGRDDDAAAEAGGRSSIPDAPAAAPGTTDANPTTSSASPSTGDSPSATSPPGSGTASATSTAAPSTDPSTTPPWEGEEQGLRLIVEGMQTDPADGSLVLKARLENKTGYDLHVPASGFLVVDQLDRSIGADTANSDFPFESEQVWPDYDFAAGTTRPGNVTLQEPLAADATVIQVRFTVARLDPSNGRTTHFTVSTDIGL
ncbi:hypothetical protein [Modestobacter sp. KNN46-3]|uniref:hypothetical protein n=1 Tax=Modestobacter sp. KNN46-3 TaxID=2711218 RepID=UPI0013DF6F3C|nr:hypothetical protein [Modestobacter sp. KNN46-3]